MLLPRLGSAPRGESGAPRSGPGEGGPLSSFRSQARKAVRARAQADSPVLRGSPTRSASGPARKSHIAASSPRACARAESASGRSAPATAATLPRASAVPAAPGRDPYSLASRVAYHPDLNMPASATAREKRTPPPRISARLRPGVSEDSERGLEERAYGGGKGHGEADLDVGKGKLASNERPCRFFRSADELVKRFDEKAREGKGSGREEAEASMLGHVALLNAGGPSVGGAAPREMVWGVSR